jgi:hypothetical protein
MSQGSLAAVCSRALLPSPNRDLDEELTNDAEETQLGQIT